MGLEIKYGAHIKELTWLMNLMFITKLYLYFYWKVKAESEVAKF